MPHPEDSKTTPLNKEKSPAFQFYPKDFLTDAKVLCMPNEVVGMYIKLLSVDWLEDGIFPETVLALCNFDWLSHDGTLRSDSSEVEAQLLGCFIPHPEKPDRVTNPRIYKERQRQIERRHAATKNGQKGGKARVAKHLNGQATLEASSSKPQADSSSSSSTPTSSSTSINKKKSALTSADFQFPERLNRPECKSAVDEWIQHRTELKKPITKSAIEQLLKKYSQRPSELIRDIRHSVMNGWQGLFPPKIDAAQPAFRTSAQGPPSRPHPKEYIPEWEKPGFKPATGPLEELKKIKEA